MVEKMRAEDPSFFAERRNLLLGVCVDAFNPFNTGTYSVTPIVICIFNFNPKVCGILLSPFILLTSNTLSVASAAHHFAPCDDTM